MNVKNLYCPKVTVSFLKTDEFSPQAKIEDGIVWIETIDGNGKKFWTRADALMSQDKANEIALNRLLYHVWSVAFNNMGMSKAELKRRLITEGLISK